MFTGIIQEVGVVDRVEVVGGAGQLRVRCATVLEAVSIGDSISVNGCCLTVTERSDDGFVADMMGETLDRTALGDVAAGNGVNLERALRLADRLDGHLVQGHVDGVAEVRSLVSHGEWTVMTFGLPSELAPYVAEKGSIAVDGVSLTVTAVDEDTFSVGLIPHTLAVTALRDRGPGDRVNLEVDVLAKYVARLLATQRAVPAATNTLEGR